MSNLSPAAILYDSSGNEKGIPANPVSVDGVVTSTLVESDSFGSGIVATRYNQLEVAFDQVDPDAITTITVTKSNGGDAVNSAGQAVFTTGTATNGGIKAVTNTSVAYRPHAEVYAAFTCIFTAGVADSYQRIGIYDASNGFFIGYEGTAFGLTLRKGGVDTRIARASFSLDPLTGGASSKYTRNGVPESMDPTKDQLYRIRFGWLGAAPITFEILSPDGGWVPFHVYKHPNLTAGTSINNPDLPIALDAQKTAGATNISMSTACWAAGTTSDLAPVTSTVTANSLATFTRSVITGQTTAGGGGFINVKVNPSGAMITATDIDSYGGTPVSATNGFYVRPGTGAVFPVNDNGGSLTVDGTVTANQGGTWNINNVTGTVSLPTGAATSANQTTIGSQTTKINDGTNTAAVKAASTAALATDPALVVSVSPNSPLPAGTNALGTVTAVQTTASNLNALAAQGAAAALSGGWPVKVTDGTNTQPTGDAAARSIFTQVSDGTNGPVAVKPASTAAQAADPALVTAFSPNTPLPVGTNEVGKVAQGTAAALSGRWPVQVTDGTNVMPTGDVAARSVFNQISDGTTGPVAVKPASTAALAADKSLVVGLSPNSPLPAGTNLLGTVKSRLYDANNFAVRSTTGQELRVAQLYQMGDFQSRYALEPYHWDVLTATGGTVTHLPTQAALKVEATASSGSTAHIRTNTFFKYQCGFAQLVGMTLLHSDTGQASQVRQWGYFDDDNGLFYQLSGTSLSIVKRSGTSGSPVDTVYPQASWNVDPLDGTGPSGITLDVSKGNGYEIEMFCYGVATVRFFINGILVHVQNFFNTLTVPYMGNGSLPASIRVNNTGASSTGSITVLTARVVSEGVTHDPFSRTFSAGNALPVEVGITERPVFSIRPKATFNSLTNRSWLLPQFVNIATEGYKIFYKVVVNATLTGASWVSAGTESTAEYDVSATAYSGGDVVYRHFIPLDDDSDDADMTRFFDFFGRKLRNAGFLGLGANVADVLTVVAVNAAVGKTEVTANVTWQEVRA